MEPRERPAAWTEPQIESAVIAVLTSRFSDSEMTEIEIHEREASSIAADIIRQLAIDDLQHCVQS